MSESAFEFADRYDVLMEFGRAPVLPLKASRPQMKICAICGQTFDMRKLAQAYHHGPEPHQPL